MSLMENPRLDNVVLPQDERPARPDGKCFYCHEPIFSTHGPECVIPQKRVRLRVTLEYETYVPRHWDKHSIEFHRNDGSWCADNIVSDLEGYLAEKPKDLLPHQGYCHLCPDAEFEYLGDVPEPENMKREAQNP